MNLDTVKNNIKNKSTTLTGALVKTALDGGISNETAYYFDIISEHSISVENDITNNFLENNTAIQDVIAHNPITITLGGLIGELVYVPSTNNSRFLGKLYKNLNVDPNNNLRDYVVTDKLSTIGQLFPPVDNLTQLAKNTAVYIEDSLDRYKKIYKNIVRNINDRSRIEDVYKKLRVLRENNTSFIVVTPFGAFDNMYIQSLNIQQGNEDNIANLSLTLKQLNFANVEFTAPDENVLSKYRQMAQAETENYGKADGSKKDGLFYSWVGRPFNVPYSTLNDLRQ